MYFSEYLGMTEMWKLQFEKHELSAWKGWIRAKSCSHFWIFLRLPVTWIKEGWPSHRCCSTMAAMAYAVWNLCQGGCWLRKAPLLRMRERSQRGYVQTVWSHFLNISTHVFVAIAPTTTMVGQSPRWSWTSAWSEFQSLVAQPWSPKPQIA